jgi:hypothetical protein
MRSFQSLKGTLKDVDYHTSNFRTTEKSSKGEQAAKKPRAVPSLVDSRALLIFLTFGKELECAGLCALWHRG